MTKLLAIFSGGWGGALAALAIFAALLLAGRALYSHGYDTRDALCTASMATATAERTGVALDATNGLRLKEGLANNLRMKAADEYDHTFAGILADTGLVRAASDGLRGDIAALQATSGGPVPNDPAFERERQATRALGAALAACSAEHDRLAQDVAERIARGRKCQGEYGAAQALSAAKPASAAEVSSGPG